MKGLRQAKASPVVVFTQLCESGFIALQNVRRWFPIQPQTAAAQTLSRMGFRHLKCSWPAQNIARSNLWSISRSTCFGNKTPKKLPMCRKRNSSREDHPGLALTSFTFVKYRLEYCFLIINQLKILPSTSYS